MADESRPKMPIIARRPLLTSTFRRFAFVSALARVMPARYYPDEGVVRCAAPHVVNAEEWRSVVLSSRARP